ncbi:unnamed protein product, partial [marine sediment metagenome]
DTHCDGFPRASAEAFRNGFQKLFHSLHLML